MYPAWTTTVEKVDENTYHGSGPGGDEFVIRPDLNREFLTKCITHRLCVISQHCFTTDNGNSIYVICVTSLIMVESEQPTYALSTEGSGREKLRAVGIAIGLTILAVLFSAVVGVLFAVPLFVLGFEFESTVVFVTLLLGGQVGFFAAGYLYVRRYDLEVRTAQLNRRDLMYAGGGTVVALVFASVMGVVMEVIGLTPESVLEEFVTADPLILIWLALLSIVVVAPAEEYLFRGVIQGRLRKTFTPVGAILGASLLFGSIHFGNSVGSLGTVVGWALLIAGVGVIMGAIYERTNNLIVPIIAHAVYNFFLFIVGYLLL